MKYKCPPIYKYGLLLIIIYMLFKHQKIVPADKLLINSVIITLVIWLLDYMLIREHEHIFGNDVNDDKHEKFKNDFDDGEIEEIINSYDVNIKPSIDDDEIIEQGEQQERDDTGYIRSYQREHFTMPSKSSRKMDKYSGRQYYNTMNMNS